MRRLAIPLLATLLLTGCVKRSRPETGPPSPPTPPVSTGAAAAALARSLLGAPYRDGGADPAGFDCSGFVQFVFRQIGVALPRSVGEQASAGEGVERASLREGDLVLYAIDGRTISHVGIVSGSGTFVHAPSSRGVVREESLDAAYWRTRFAGARRVARP